MKKEDMKVISSEWIHQGFVSIKRYVLKHKLFEGGWSRELTREIAIRPGAAGVLPYDPALDKVVLIEQFRAGAIEGEESPWLFEIVAGIKEPNESVELLARREAKEEAGIDLLDLVPISEYWTSPGGSSERVSLFCGKVDASKANGIHGLEEEGEDIRVHVMDATEAFKLVEENKINNAMSIVALMWLALNKAKIQDAWK